MGLRSIATMSRVRGSTSAGMFLLVGQCQAVIMITLITMHPYCIDMQTTMFYNIVFVMKLGGVLGSV